MANVIVAPRVRDLDELAGQLAGWMSARLPRAKGMRIESLAYPFGAGRSHETILFDAHWTEDGREVVKGCVVRIKPVTHLVFPDDLFDKQYQLMKVLSEGGWVPVATPLWFEADPSLLGAPFFVMEKRRGRVAVSIPPYAREGWVAEATPAQRRKFWENGVRQLAAIQTVPLSKLDFLAGPNGLRGFEQEWDKYARFVDWVSQDKRWPVLDAALAHLKARWPKNRPEGLVWGDARLGNIMFDENFEVVAVMDWEQPSLGGALQDLAWWLFISNIMHGEGGAGGTHLAGMGTREETIALWTELSGKSAEDIEWYEDFMALKVACMSMRMFVLEGTPPQDHSGLAKRLGLKV